MIKEIEFIDTAGSCLIDESNVFNDEHQSIFQIQCTKLLGGGSSQNTSSSKFISH